jgi:protocatechuate 3,4-dioxygenase beta subunit
MKATSDEMLLLKTFQNIPNSSKLTMTTENEPGTQLMLCLIFVNKKTKEPLQNQKVLLYQTSEDGSYHPEVANDEKTARIRAVGYTDTKGRLFVKTILPGSYATSGDNRHIHTQVFDARPQAYDMHFKQYTSARMARFIEERDQFFLVDLKRVNKENLLGFMTIAVKNPKQE